MRIYYDTNDITCDKIELVDENYHYIKNVKRLTKGKSIDIVTNTHLIEAAIEDINKRNIILSVISSRELIKPKYTFRVYQCLLKREYMDFVMEKYGELGVTEVYPVISKYTVVDFKSTTLRRYKELAKNGSLQSENENITSIHEPIKIEDVTACNGQNLLFYERGATNKFSVDCDEINIIIGPEGGFSEDEVNMLISKGFDSVTPFSSVLKAETAAVIFAGLVRMGL